MEWGLDLWSIHNFNTKDATKTSTGAQNRAVWSKNVYKALHISLEQNLTNRSHDGGKEGHFCNCGDTSVHLPLTRSAQPLGQLSLYLLNEFNSL